MLKARLRGLSYHLLRPVWLDGWHLRLGAALPGDREALITRLVAALLTAISATIFNGWEAGLQSFVTAVVIAGWNEHRDLKRRGRFS